MSMIIHVREGGGLKDVHVDSVFFGKCSILANYVVKVDLYSPFSFCDYF